MISYELFRRMINFDFNTTKFLVDTEAAKLVNNMDECERLVIQKQLHVSKADKFYELLKSRKTSIQQTDMVICFDYQKNLPLPVTNVSDEYYRHQLWLNTLVFMIFKIKRLKCSCILNTMHKNHQMKLYLV